MIVSCSLFNETEGPVSLSSCHQDFVGLLFGALDKHLLDMGGASI